MSEFLITAKELSHEVRAHVHQPARPGRGACRPRSSSRPTWRCSRWFEKYGSVIVNQGAELTPPETATSVKTGDDGSAVVVDGPFSEAKESIGGFTIIEVPDLDAAIAMVKEWPAIGLPGGAVEIRPMVEDYSQFEQTPETAQAT